MNARRLALIAFAALLVAGCAQLRQSAKLLDPPEVPTDSEAAIIEANAPYPNVFQDAINPRPSRLMGRSEQEALESDLDAARTGHVAANQRRLEARR